DRQAIVAPANDARENIRRALANLNLGTRDRIQSLANGPFDGVYATFPGADWNQGDVELALVAAARAPPGFWTGARHHVLELSGEHGRARASFHGLHDTAHGFERCSHGQL